MSTLPDQVPSAHDLGDSALELASELTDRIARERETVRALKRHLIDTGIGEDAPDADGGTERLQAPRRRAPSRGAAAEDDGAAGAGSEAWESLGPCLDVRRTQTGAGSVVLELAGEVDLSGSLRLRQLVREELDRGLRTLSLDLAEVCFLDSNALSALLWARREAALDKTAFHIPALHPQLRRLLVITKLDAILLGGPPRD